MIPASFGNATCFNGAEQPSFEARATAAVTDEVIQVALGKSVEIPFELPGPMVEELGAREGRAFLVIRQRSLTDNTFVVRFQLDAEGALAPPEAPDRVKHLIDIPFFDHLDDEHHAVGDLVASDGPLGHFFIEATQVLEVLREEGVVDSVASLQVAPMMIHPEVRAEVGFFALGEVSIDVVEGVV